MLQRVILSLVYAGKELAEGIRLRLEAEGLTVLPEKLLCGNAGEENEINGKDIIFLTDNRVGEKLAEQWDVPCLGLEINERLHTKYIVLGQEQINRKYMEHIRQRFYGIPWEILETKRCILREMQEDDLEAIYEIYDGSVSEYVETPYEDRDMERAYIRSHIEQMYGFFEYGIWLVTEKTSGKIIGRAGIANRETESEAEPEIGYIIAEKWQRKGYGEEVCRGIMEYAAEELEMLFLNCYIEPENIPSRCLAEKLGFEFKGEVNEMNLLWYRKNL